jgi:hypothetical protein
MDTHRRPVVAGLLVIGLLGVVPQASVATAAASRHHRSCPAAESLVPGTTWHHHALANGVTMADGIAKDSRGTVNMHVLRVDLSQPRVHAVPLEHHVANRSPLTSLAHGHPQLVAATNTSYFDFDTGAPTVPLIVGGSAQVISDSHETVVGIGKDGRVEAGQVWLAGSVTAGKQSQPLHQVNEPFPGSGLGVYDGRWGSARVPGTWNTVNREVVNGKIAAGTVSSRNASVPSNGFVLQARGRPAADWLRGIAGGTQVSVNKSFKAAAASRFRQAYGVGVQLVSQPGAAKTGFSCDSSNTRTPARTAIGWSNGGRTLVMVVVADHPDTSMHGLDQDQMSKLMVQLGVSKAYSFDGSGSTELLARLKGKSSLAMQNYPADGAERPMPVGLGIAVAPAKSHTKSGHHRGHHRHAHHRRARHHHRHHKHH